MKERGRSTTIASVTSDAEECNEEVRDGVLSRNGGSFAERRAAKCGAGFTAPRINTARFRTASPTASPSVRSPRLTIPPGISPAALLDSPIMLLNNTQALLSPTTGTFSISCLNDENSMLIPMIPEEAYKDSNTCSSFRFKSNWDLDSLPSSMSIENQEADIDCQTIESEQFPIDFGLPAEFPTNIPAIKCSAVDSSKNQNLYMNKLCSDMQNSHSDIGSDETLFIKESTRREDTETHDPGGPRGSYPSGDIQRNSTDGYNWRKYGQKQVKGSEYPRSYYKCTHPNCPVKKKVERSHDGQITEIIYKGAHNHEKPQANNCSVIGSTMSFADASEIGEVSRHGIKIESGSGWRNLQSGSRDLKSISDLRADGVQRTSPTSVVSNLSDPFSTTQLKTVGFESAGAAEHSSTFASHDEDDRVTQGSISAGSDVDGEESESKRRRTEVETNLSSRTVREPRVIIQIETEVDILDDGYRWRKYGQKVVKGNPNPRSYYKCTSADCSVRKHVERASNNLKCVITTYEGRHNHEVPAARSTNQITSISDSAHSANAQSAISQAATVSKHETKAREFANFDPKPEFNNPYMRPGCFGNFNNDMKFGASSIYPMKVPFFQNPVSYGSYGFDPNYTVTTHSSCITSMVPDFPIPLNHNLSASGFNFSNGRTLGPVQTYVARSQLKEDNGRFLKPKQEHKDDNVSPVSTTPLDNANLSSFWSSPSVNQYRAINFP